MNVNSMVKSFIYSRRKGLDGAKAKCADGTIKIYERHLSTFATWLMTEAQVTAYENITRNHMRGFLEHLDVRVAERIWADSTRLQMLRSLRTFFHWVERDEECIEEGLHLKRLHRHLPVIPQGEPRKDIPQNFDLGRFREAFNTETVVGFRDYVMTSLMATNGVRVGEVCNLEMNAMKLDDYPPTLIVNGKTGPRVVPVTKEMVKLLRAWTRRRSQLKPAADSPYVFVSRMKGKLNSVVIGKAFRRNRERLGLPRITPHTFRHAFCTNYLSKGGDIGRLKTITGHSSYQMLQNYVDSAKVASTSAHDELEKINLLKDISVYYGRINIG